MKNRTKEINEYKRLHVKRIGFEMQKQDFEELKSHVDETGETVNGFIKRAISETIKRDKKPDGE